MGCGFGEAGRRLGAGEAARYIAVGAGEGVLPYMFVGVGVGEADASSLILGARLARFLDSRLSCLLGGGDGTRKVVSSLSWLVEAFLAIAPGA